MLLRGEHKYIKGAKNAYWNFFAPLMYLCFAIKVLSYSVNVRLEDISGSLPSGRVGWVLGGFLDVFSFSSFG